MNRARGIGFSCVPAFTAATSPAPPGDVTCAARKGPYPAGHGHAEGTVTFWCRLSVALVQVPSGVVDFSGVCDEVLVLFPVLLASAFLLDPALAIVDEPVKSPVKSRARFTTFIPVKTSWGRGLGRGSV